MTDIFDIDVFLAHHGIKGQRWGVRREDPSGTDNSFNNSGVVMGRDGSITVKKGASLQRLTRSSGQSLPMKDLTFASLNEYDNARYIKVIGGKGFLGGGRDQILSIQATKPIKAPSVEEATRIHSELMLSNATFRKKNTNVLGVEIQPKELERIRNSPTGRTAQAWYHQTNVKMTFDKDYDPDAPYVQKVVREEMLKRGFNALRDENDVSSKIAKAPIIIFNPQDSLRVVSTTQITDSLRKANKAQLKQYKKLGDDFVNEQLYGPNS